MSINQITIGDIILSAAETNIEFRNLYKKLLTCYGATIFSNSFKIKLPIKMLTIYYDMQIYFQNRMLPIK